MYMKNAFVQCGSFYGGKYFWNILKTIQYVHPEVPPLNISAERPSTCTIQLTILKMPS